MYVDSLSFRHLVVSIRGFPHTHILSSFKHKETSVGNNVLMT